MEIKWKDIENKHCKLIDKWLSESDRHNLCMQNKNWKQTANDINECLALMNDSQFKNVIGYINDIPAIALMFGIERIKTLNLYNIVVNPKFRQMGITKNVILRLLNGENDLKLVKPYNKIIVSSLPENNQIQQLLKELDFINLGFDGEYIVFEKNRKCIEIKNLDKIF